MGKDASADQVGTAEARKPGLFGRLVATHWVALLLALVTIVFIAQNRAEVPIQVFWIEVRAPLWFALVGTALVGLLVGVLGSRRRTARAARV